MKKEEFRDLQEDAMVFFDNDLYCVSCKYPDGIVEILDEDGIEIEVNYKDLELE